MGSRCLGSRLLWCLLVGFAAVACGDSESRGLAGTGGAAGAGGTTNGGNGGAAAASSGGQAGGAGVSTGGNAVGGSSGAGGSSGGAGGAPLMLGSDDVACTQVGGAADCAACCSDLHPSWEDVAPVTRACVCDTPGSCATQCPDYCAAGADSPTCYACIFPTLVPQGECYAGGKQSCAGDTDCLYYVDCRANCVLTLGT